MVRSPVAVGVFFADASRLESAHGEPALRARLTADERARMQAMISAKRRREFLASRVLVRAALIQWAGPAAAHWELVTAAGQAPFLRLPGSGAVTTSPGLPALSWSHSQDAIVCAICDTGDLGADVEQPRARELDAIANRVLADSERAVFERQTGPARLESFFRFWTLKEACSKALGTGMGTPLRELVFEWGDAEPSTIRFTPTKLALTDKVAEFVSFRLDAQTIAALALLLPRPSRQLTVRFQSMESVGEFTECRVDWLASTSPRMSASFE